MQFDSNISKLLIFVGSYVFTSEQNMVRTSKYPNTFGEFEVIDQFVFGSDLFDINIGLIVFQS